MDANKKIFVSYGGGCDSTAMLIGMYLREITPEAILFADTGGEFQEVYDHVGRMNEWCKRVGFPAIVTVNAARPDAANLEEECLKNETLPSKAFGNAGCSVKWKRQPIDKWLKEQGYSDPRQRFIGINFDEVRRGQIPNTETDEFCYPLRQWRWGRKDVQRVCLAVFGYTPHKSACFYCPAMKKKEVIALAKEKPELFERAVAMERNAAQHLETVKGLGRAWSWETLVKADAAQSKLMFEVVEPFCVGECDT